jgi:hypothetical protein
MAGSDDAADAVEVGFAHGGAGGKAQAAVEQVLGDFAADCSRPIPLFWVYPMRHALCATRFNPEHRLHMHRFPYRADFDAFCFQQQLEAWNPFTDFTSNAKPVKRLNREGAKYAKVFCPNRVRQPIEPGWRYDSNKDVVPAAGLACNLKSTIADDLCRGYCESA